MARSYEVHCDCCGLLVDVTQVEFCPRCQYPVQPEQEQRFLEAAIRDLKRVMRYGGASIRVMDLAWRYEGRLQFLLSHKGQRTAQPETVSSAQMPVGISSLIQEPSTSIQIQPQIPAVPQSGRVAPDMAGAPDVSQTAIMRPDTEAPGILQPGMARSDTAGTPGASQAGVLWSDATVPGAFPHRQANPGGTVHATVPEPPVVPITPAASMRGFSFSSDAVVNILAALGGFFILAGSLSFVLTTSNLWLSFLAVFALHAVFGGAGLFTRRRVPLLRAVSPLYTLIFALLVPLVAFSAYRLVTNGLVGLSVPSLLTLAALYAAAIYALLAVAQRFVPFAYLSMVALLVGDLALAQALSLAYWWWPCVLLLLAFPALLMLPRAPGDGEPLPETWVILRTPLRILMWLVVGAACTLLPLMLAYSLVLDGLHSSLQEPRLALLTLSILLFTWTALYIWRVRARNWTPLLAYMLPGVLALLGYALRLDSTGYVLLLTGTALAYHALVRLVDTRLATYSLPGLALDQVALGLCALVVLLAASATPFQLIYRAYAGSSAQNNLLFTGNSFLFQFVRSRGLTLDLFALGICFLLTLDITAMRAGLSRVPARASWCWLLLFSGLILASAYGIEVLLWQFSPFLAFLVLTLAALTCAVLARRFASTAWSNPLDVLALGGIAFTLVLGLGQSQDIISALLLGFAALLYLVLLIQHRPLPSVLCAALLVLALPPLFTHLPLILALGLLLPLLAASMQRANPFGGETPYAQVFAWTLLGPALLYGFILVNLDVSSGQSVFAGWSGLPLQAAYEIALPGIIWYATAVIARVQLYLVPAALCWLVALLLPVDDFWTLTILTPLLALVAASIERRTNFIWALPFYLAALFGAGMVGYTGLVYEHVTALSWVLLAFALLAYGLGLFTEHRAALWLTPLFATGAVIVAAALLGDLYRPPVVALLGAALGLASSRSTWLAQRRQAPALLYALPLYVSALAAALLTGVYGTLGNINRPFYGALPTALLLYALATFAVLLIERRPSWNWLVAVFAGWAVVLTQHLVLTYMLGAGVGLVLCGLLSGRLLRTTSLAERAARWHGLEKFTWNWPWYAAFLVATFVLASVPAAPRVLAPAMLVFTLLATIVLLVERVPEFLVFPAGMAAWTVYLWLPASQPVLVIVTYTLLCVLLFASQFTWRRLSAATHWLPETGLHNALSLGGLCAVLLYALGQGALSAYAGGLAHAGVFALFSLSMLLGLYGLIHPSTVARTLPQEISQAQRVARLEAARVVCHWCLYGAGMLLTLVVSWELLAFQQTRFDVLTLVPASYLIVLAPLLLRDTVLPERHFAGQAAALLGAALLLLPDLWLSFNGTALLPTLLLLAESLALLILGLLTRLRIFILSSAALIVLGTLRLLFLSIPQSVPVLLIVFGSLLVLLATTLILSRHRLQAAWRRWE